MRRILFAILRFGLGIGLLIYLIESKIVRLSALSRLLTAWPVSVAAILLILVDMGLMAWRLCWVFRPQRLRLSWADSLRLTLLGSFFANFLPGRAGGDLAKIFYASKGNAGRRAEIVTVLLFDRAIGLFSLLLLPLLLMPLFPQLLRLEAVRVALGIVIACALAMALMFSACLAVPATLKRWIARSPKIGQSKDLLPRLIGAIAVYRGRPGILAGALAISLADNLMALWILALAILVVDPASLAMKLSVLIPIGEIVNSLPLTPGGLGVGETAFHEIFGIAGLRGGADALLCWRIWNAAAGLLGLVFYVRGFRAQIPRSMYEPADGPAAMP